MLGEGCSSSFSSCFRCVLDIYFVGLKVLLVRLVAPVVDLITNGHGLIQLFTRHLPHKSPQPLQLSCQLSVYPKQFISRCQIHMSWRNWKNSRNLLQSTDVLLCLFIHYVFQLFSSCSQ